MYLAEQHIGELWHSLLGHLLRAPKVTARGVGTRELTGVSLTLADARNNVLISRQRDLNYRFLVAEWVWIASGRQDVASIAAYNSRIAQFSDNGEHFFGAYGPRIADHWEEKLDLCRRDPGTRQAVLVTYRHPPNGGTKDLPCTLTLQLLPREGKLHLVVNMRSSDVWLGLPYDVFNFTMLQNAAAGELGLEVGWLRLNLGSSHLYDRDESAALLARAGTSGYLRSPKLPGNLPPHLEAALLRQPRPEGDQPAYVWNRYENALRAKDKAAALEYLRA
jgi:thymidylate synthase